MKGLLGRGTPPFHIGHSAAPSEKLTQVPQLLRKSCASVAQERNVGSALISTDSIPSSR
jgi:hypothetical protein